MPRWFYNCFAKTSRNTYPLYYITDNKNGKQCYFMSLVQFISKPNQDNTRREDHRGISCKNHAKIAILAKKISKIIVIKKQHFSN